MYRHLLVPLDDSELAAALVTQAVALARSLDARITFLTVREDYGASDEGALQRSLAPGYFAEQAAGAANAILAKALAAAQAQGVVCAGVSRTGARPYEHIVDLAEDGGCDLIVMASHGRRGLRALVVGSQTQKVLAHARLPVLVVTVERTARADAEQAALDIIRDEHRAIAAVLDGLSAQAARLRAGDAGGLDFVGALLRYLRDFPETLHHPKEELYLFAALVGRSAECAEPIAALEAEHRAGRQQIDELEALRARCVAERPAPLAALAARLDAYAEAQWRHLSTEEKLILPAAQRHLEAQDWQAIEQAFRGNGDLRRGGAREAAFAQAFARLMNRAAETANG